MLGCTSESVYFCVPAGSGSTPSQLVCSVPKNGGGYTEVLTVKGNTNPQVTNGHIYCMEDTTLVSYAPTGSGRHEIASLPNTVSNANIWNISPRYAFVIGTAKSYEDGGTFRIDLQTGALEKVGGMEQYANLNIVDDVLLVKFIDESYERWNLNLEKQSDIWPNASAHKVEIAASSPTDGSSSVHDDNAQTKLAEFEQRLADYKTAYESKNGQASTTREMSSTAGDYADNLTSLMQEIYEYVANMPNVDKTELDQSQGEWQAALDKELDELTEAFKKRTIGTIYHINYPSTKAAATEERINALLDMIRNA